MAGIVTIDIKGVNELVTAWDTLTDRVRRKILSTALRKGAKVVHSTAVPDIPVKTGVTKKKLKVLAGKYKRGGPVRMRVVLMGVYRKSDAFGAPLELGHKFKFRKTAFKLRQDYRADSVTGYAKPRPFLRSAAKSQRSAVEKIIKDAFRYGIAVEAAVGTIK